MLDVVTVRPVGLRPEPFLAPPLVFVVIVSSDPHHSHLAASGCCVQLSHFLQWSSFIEVWRHYRFLMRASPIRRIHI